MDTPRLTRRDTLKLGAFGAAVVTLPLSTTLAAQGTSAFDVRSLRPYTAPLPVPTPAKPTTPPEGWPYGTSADFYRMEQRVVEAEIIPGYKTSLFAYGTVDADGSNFQGGVPGPTIIAKRERKVVMRMRNGLPTKHPTLGYEAWTSCHLHGSPSKPQYDGYASDITRPTRDGKTPGQWKDYEYENKMTPRTLWYHDHGVHHTAENAYMGLAAQYHCIQDGVNLSGVKLPSTYGVDDIPLMVADKAFAAPRTVDGVKRAELLFDDAGHSNTFGDVITVNGKAWPYLEVEPRVYRFRFLNAGLSRSYMVALSNNADMAIVALDGGFMKKVKRVKQFRAGMAERFEVLVDFSKSAGQTINMVN